MQEIVLSSNCLIRRKKCDIHLPDASIDYKLARISHEQCVNLAGVILSRYFRQDGETFQTLHYVHEKCGLVLALSDGCTKRSFF